MGSALPKKRGGRSGVPVYSRELEDIICTRLAEGETLNAICRTPGMPCPSAVRQWVLADKPAGIAARYARAREYGYEAMADELFDIADDRSCLGKPDASAAVQQQRLATDVRRWYLSKVLPHLLAIASRWSAIPISLSSPALSWWGSRRA